MSAAETAYLPGGRLAVPTPARRFGRAYRLGAHGRSTHSGHTTVGAMLYYYGVMAVEHVRYWPALPTEGRTVASPSRRPFFSKSTYGHVWTRSFTRSCELYCDTLFM